MKNFVLSISLVVLASASFGRGTPVKAPVNSNDAVRLVDLRNATGWAETAYFYDDFERADTVEGYVSDPPVGLPYDYPGYTANDTAYIVDGCLFSTNASYTRQTLPSGMVVTNMGAKVKFDDVEYTTGGFVTFLIMHDGNNWLPQEFFHCKFNVEGWVIEVCTNGLTEKVSVSGNFPRDSFRIDTEYLVEIQIVNETVRMICNGVQVGELTHDAVASANGRYCIWEPMRGVTRIEEVWINDTRGSGNVIGKNVQPHSVLLDEIALGNADLPGTIRGGTFEAKKNNWTAVLSAEQARYYSDFTASGCGAGMVETSLGYCIQREEHIGSEAGQLLRWTAKGYFESNSNQKQIYLKMPGAGIIVDSGVVTMSGAWELTADCWTSDDIQYNWAGKITLPDGTVITGRATHDNQLTNYDTRLYGKGTALDDTVKTSIIIDWFKY